MKGERKFYGIVMLLIILLAYEEMVAAQPRLCTSHSHFHKGWCLRHHGCAIACMHEGFTGGFCKGWRLCTCTKHCKLGGGGGGEHPSFGGGGGEHPPFGGGYGGGGEEEQPYGGGPGSGFPRRLLVLRGEDEYPTLPQQKDQFLPNLDIQNMAN